MLLLNRTIPTQIRTVNFDAYGNAIPNVPSIHIEGSSIAATIVKTREVLIRPRNKNKTDRRTANQVSLLYRLLSWTERSKPKNLPARKEDGSDKLEYIPKQTIQTQTENLSEFIELSFQKLQGEFDSREEQLEKRFQSLAQHNQRVLTKKNRWFIPIALASAIGGGYMLYVLTNMQHSMIIMSSSIPAMNQHMGNMANDTQIMSGNMQTMNQSMDRLNNNVYQMNTQVYQMNRQMGAISHSIAPMGKAAASTQPFLGMMRSFMPF